MPHGHSNLWIDRASELWAVQTHPMSTQLLPSLRWVGGAQHHSLSTAIFLKRTNTSLSLPRIRSFPWAEVDTATQCMIVVHHHGNHGNGTWKSMAYHCPLVKSTFTCNAELGTFLVGFTIRKSTIETETSESGTCNLERATWDLQYGNDEMDVTWYFTFGTAF